jgi:nucleoid DNA-binding protein
LYTYGKFGEQYGSRTFASGERARLVRLLRRVGVDKFRFSPDIIRPVLEKNRADIEWMEARLGQSLREELEHQPGDVRDASDFLIPDPEGVGKLLSLLGDQAPAGVTGKTVEEVVWLVHLLRRTLTSAPGSHDERADSAKPVIGRKRFGNSRKTRMNVAELTAQIQKVNAQLLDGIPQNRAEALVSGVFQHIKAALAGTEDRVVDYAGLGRFRVRKVRSNKAAGRQAARAAIKFRRAEAGTDRKGDYAAETET